MFASVTSKLEAEDRVSWSFIDFLKFKIEKKKKN